MTDSGDLESDPDDTRVISAVPNPAVPEPPSDGPTVTRPNRAASDGAPLISSVPEFRSRDDEIVLGPPLERPATAVRGEEVAAKPERFGADDGGPDSVGVASDTVTISRPRAPSIDGPDRCSRRPRDRMRTRVVWAAVAAVAILAVIGAYLATRAVRSHAASSDRSAVTTVVPTVATAPSTTVPTEEGVAKQAVAGPHSLALKMMSCVGIDQCPRQETQSVTVACGGVGCVIVDGPDAVWVGNSTPLVQQVDPRHFIATASMKPGKGFGCNGNNVATVAVLDLHVVSPNLLLTVGHRLPIMGTMTVRTATPEPSCGAVAPKIVWSLSEAA